MTVACKFLLVDHAPSVSLGIYWPSPISRGYFSDASSHRENVASAGRVENARLLLKYIMRDKALKVYYFAS